MKLSGYCPVSRDTAVPRGQGWDQGEMATGWWPDPSILRFPGAVDRSQRFLSGGVSPSVIKELALIHVPKPWMVPGKATCNLAAFSVLLSPSVFPHSLSSPFLPLLPLLPPPVLD